MNRSKAVIADAAVAGLLTGSLAVRAHAARTPHNKEGVPQTEQEPLENLQASVSRSKRGG